MTSLGFFTLADIDPRFARVERELDVAAGFSQASAPRAARADDAPAIVPHMRATETTTGEI